MVSVMISGAKLFPGAVDEKGAVNELEKLRHELRIT